MYLYICLSLLLHFVLCELFRFTSLALHIFFSPISLPKSCTSWQLKCMLPFQYMGVALILETDECAAALPLLIFSLS